MKLPFLSKDQLDKLAFIRTQQADYEVDILVLAGSLSEDILNLPFGIK